MNLRNHLDSVVNSVGHFDLLNVRVKSLININEV